MKNKEDSMRVETVPCSFDNYSYLLICEKTNQAAVVDPTEAYPLLSRIAKAGASLSAVFCTHHHQDHVGEIDALLHEFAGVDVFCHSSDRSRIAAATRGVEDGHEVGFGEERGRVLHTPGHTRGSICYLFESRLFVGDTVFGAGCGRLFEGDARQMHGSLMEKIAVLPEETSIYFGHEYTLKNLSFAAQVEPGNEAIEKRRSTLDAETISTPTTLELEKRTNPFFRATAPAVRQFAGGRGVDENDEVAVFALLRRLRNDF